jgi:hypothetical protein
VPVSVVPVRSRAVLAVVGATDEGVVAVTGGAGVGDTGVVTMVVITDCGWRGGRGAAGRACDAPRRARRRRTVTCRALRRSESARTGTARVRRLEPRWSRPAVALCDVAADLWARVCAATETLAVDRGRRGRADDRHQRRSPPANPRQPGALTAPARGTRGLRLGGRTHRVVHRRRALAPEVPGVLDHVTVVAVVHRIVVRVSVSARPDRDEFLRWTHPIAGEADHVLRVGVAVAVHGVAIFRFYGICSAFP